MRIFYFYRSQRSWAKVIFSQACVCPQGGRGVCLSACWDIPPGADTPQTRHPPGSRHPLGADPPDQASPREQTPPRPGTPPEADCSIQLMSSWYASYWNASLLAKLDSFVGMYWNKNKFKQECISVGCVPPTAVAIRGGLLHAPPEPDPPWEQAPQEQAPPARDTPQSGHPQTRHPPEQVPPDQTPPGAGTHPREQNSWHTLLKILPCPKLCFRAVTKCDS